MANLLSLFRGTLRKFSKNSFKNLIFTKKGRYKLAAIVDLACIFLILINVSQPATRMIQPLISPFQGLTPLTESKNGYEVFGFAPYWTFNKLNNVDFNVLTTLAYFGVEAGEDGNLIKDDPGYQVFKSKKATDLFKKAHDSGTRVVLTITQMQNGSIRQLLNDPEAQTRLIVQTVDEVEKRGIDGINIDFEYMGDPGQDYRNKFSKFVADMTNYMHAKNPRSKVTVSVYASAVKDPKVYDIATLGRVSDGIFMMAYDFAVAGSDNAIPTAPLYGHKEGKYWYDIATAVDDFLKYMPANKLILGVPYYGYNYLVYEPTVKAETRPSYSWRGQPKAQTYSIAQEIDPQTEDIGDYQTGWDDVGKVGYKAYKVLSTDTWRMVFIEDQRSLGIKYDFVKSKSLAGVGMWALGFDDGKDELWQLLSEKFGVKLADSQIARRAIAGEEE